MTSYAPRYFRFHGLWTLPEWQVKVYSIRHASRREPDSRDLETAKALATPKLRAINAKHHHGAAFLILHFGADGDYLLIDWWTGGNMLQQTLFVRLNNQPDFEDMTGSGLLACVWELHIIDAERRAWIECVLKKDGSASSYWERTFAGEF
jgi:hypothetical protein